MFNRLYLMVAVGVGLLAGSATISNDLFAATMDDAKINNRLSGSIVPLLTSIPGVLPVANPATNIEQPQYAQRSRGGGGARNTSRNRNANRNVNRNSNRNVNRNSNRNVNRNTNRNVNVNVNVRHRGYGWRGTRWGVVVFGVTMGTIIVVAANTPPPPPHSTLCWTWSNAALTKGYWYYCSGP